MGESRNSDETGGETEAEDGDVTTDDPLAPWALASFHASLLVLVPLALAHAVAPAAVGDVLGGLDTLVGVALYLVLWGSTWWSNRRYLAACEFRDASGTLRAGARWGAVTGLPLLVCVAVVALVATNPAFAALVLVAGGLLAPLVGAVVGALFAAVDVGLDRLAAALVP